MHTKYTYSGYPVTSCGAEAMSGHCHKIKPTYKLIEKECNKVTGDDANTIYAQYLLIMKQMVVLDKAIQVYANSAAGKAITALISDAQKPYKSMHAIIEQKKDSSDSDVKAMASKLWNSVKMTKTDFFKGDQDTKLGRIQSLYSVITGYTQEQVEKAGILDSAIDFVNLVDKFNEDFDAATQTKYVQDAEATRTKANATMKELLGHWRNQINTAQGKDSTAEDKFVQALNAIWKDAKASYDIIQSAATKKAAKSNSTSTKDEEDGN